MNSSFLVRTYMEPLTLALDYDILFVCIPHVFMNPLFSEDEFFGGKAFWQIVCLTEKLFCITDIIMIGIVIKLA